MDFVSVKDAKLKGLKHYNNGRPCKNGHIGPRYVCGRSCVECASDRSRADFLANREKWREKSKRWYSDKERSRKKTAAWRLKNPERNAQNTRKWKTENHQKVRGYSDAWRARNPDKVKAVCRSWQERNLDWFANKERKRRAQKRNNGGSHTTADVKAILKAQHGRCAYCRAKLEGRKYHVDHIVALINGGRNDRANLQITCRVCNQSKHDKDPIDFARERGMLI